MHELVFYTFKEGKICEYSRRSHNGSYSLNTHSLQDGFVYINTKDGELSTLRDWHAERLGRSYVYNVSLPEGKESVLVRVNPKKGALTLVSKSEVDLYNAALQLVIDTTFDVRNRTNEYRDKVVDYGFMGLVKDMKIEVINRKLKMAKIQIIQSTPMPPLEEAI